MNYIVHMYTIKMQISDSLGIVCVGVNLLYKLAVL